ncbi:MAG: valine--tRNA ligase [Clostridiales Family XIII bacterium]|jgi:valyl-tRNA synthetase|nr:valine--tRNA ligase [Clostridiales Family XIII bacterium]
MPKNLEKNYDPKSFEDRIYGEWETGGYFHAEPDPAKKPFTIVMPPPNITGQLHMGHALDETLQDVLTRWKRLQGYSALWLPGTDHASIATEVRVSDEILKSEGKTKDDLGRDEFLKRVWKWKELYGDKITEQQRRLGNSCDWQRARFTMDEGCNKAVVAFFVRLYEKGYIYRGNRMINWCPTCGTSLSDAEVEHEDLNGKYWYFRYPGADGGAGIVVATSRPETMFGDTAIAVNPADERYTHLVGTKVVLPIVGREIPVIADPYPDPEKGTGAVKITPAHDPNDFEVGERHGLSRIVCIGFDAKMTVEAGKYEGLDRFDCRSAWVKELDAGGYLVKTEDVVIPTGHCYRCDSVVEPMISDQWFVAMEALAAPAIEAAERGELKHIPARFEKTYLHWLSEIRDWCISRQLWWGHRIPAYYCDACGEVIVSEERPTVCPKCGVGTDKIWQDEDVLDTWFSSALWPFSTLGWPEKTPDLDYFYPTNVLVTGYDIIFFWVVRMVFSAIEMTGVPPFEYVFVHGLVRDEQGRKMSKSLNNGVDPLEVIDAYGADALRFFLLNGSAAGNDMRFILKNVESTRNFANKLWNASRFVIMNLAEEGEKDEADQNRPGLSLKSRALTDEDKWILAKTEQVAAEVTENLEKFELSVATQKIYELIRDEYCDWYIEFVKARLYGTDEEAKNVCRTVLVSVLSDLLRLLHPFMPFITEEIWSYLGKDGKLIEDVWPQPAGYVAEFAEASEKIETVKEIVRAVRNIRAEANATPSRRLPIIILVDADKVQSATLGEDAAEHVKNLAGVLAVTVTADRREVPAETVSAILNGMIVYVSADDLLDYAAEKEKLAKEKARLEGEVNRLSGKLENEGFTAKAPEAVVNAEREKRASAEEGLRKVIARIAEIKDK